MTSSRRWQREKILTRGKIENEDVEYSRHPIDEKCWPMAHTIHVDILRHPRTKIGVEYVHALKMVDRSRERIVSLVFKDITGRGIFGSRSVIRPSHEFVRRCFFTREFRADTNTFNQPSHPSQLVGDAFLSLPRAGGSLARLPTLVTKTNGMYLFHGTPASGFLLSPLCIALVKHFFLSSSLSPRLSSSFFFSPPPSLPSFRCPSFFDFSFSSFTRLLAPFAVLFPLSRPFSSHRPSRSFGSSSFRTREWATHRGDDEKKST